MRRFADSDARGDAPPYDVKVGSAHCRELLLRTRRPMFDRVCLHERTAVGRPRPNVKNQDAVVFDIDSGRELDRTELEEILRHARKPEDQQSHNLWVARRAAVGEGGSVLEFHAFGSPEPVRVVEVPDATAAIKRTTFGWYVGCRDGYLYAFTRAGRLLWRWPTPEAEQFEQTGPPIANSRPCPYRVATDGKRALVASWSSIWCVNEDGSTAWGADLHGLIKPRTRHVGRRELRDAASARTAIAREGITLRFGNPFLSVSVLAGYQGNWFVGSSNGELFRFDADGRLERRLRLSSGHVRAVFDADGQIAAFASQPNVWYLESDALLRLPDEYQWPYWLHAIGGNYLIGHRPRNRHLGVIDERGQLVVQVRSPGPITDFDIGDDLIAFVAAGALVVLEFAGLSRSGMLQRKAN